MKFLLDTSACIAHLRGRSPAISASIAAHGSVIALCAPVIQELFYGAERSRDPSREKTRVQRFIDPFPTLPFDHGGVAPGSLRRGRWHQDPRPVPPR